VNKQRVSGYSTANLKVGDERCVSHVGLSVVEDMCGVVQDPQDEEEREAVPHPGQAPPRTPRHPQGGSHPQHVEELHARHVPVVTWGGGGRFVAQKKSDCRPGRRRAN
jgi:hypothetical protein